MGIVGRVMKAHVRERVPQGSMAMQRGRGMESCAVSLASARDRKNRTVSLPPCPVDARCITATIVWRPDGSSS